MSRCLGALDSMDTFAVKQRFKVTLCVRCTYALNKGSTAVKLEQERGKQNFDQ